MPFNSGRQCNAATFKELKQQIPLDNSSRPSQISEYSAVVVVVVVVVLEAAVVQVDGNSFVFADVRVPCK